MACSGVSIEFLLTSAKPRSIETPEQAILNLKGKIDVPITRGTSHYMFYYTIVLSRNLKQTQKVFSRSFFEFTMILITTKLLNYF